MNAQRLARQGRFSSERKQLARQFRRAVRKVNDLLKVVTQGLGRIGFAQAERCITADSRQKIVEFVGHAASEGAHALHFLGLQQLAFEVLALGDVALNADKMRHLAESVDDRGNGQ